MADPRTRTVRLRPDLAIPLSEAGTGRAVLLLHGGGGPATVANIAAHLSATMHVITPTHPGWDGTERPVLIDSAGVLVEGQPMIDFFALDARGVAEYSFHDPDRFYVDPATLPAEQLAQRAANMATLRVLAGEPYMYDPDLLGQARQVKIPVLVLWGDSDRIFTPEYGQAFARAFPQSQFTLIAAAGHLPHLEQPTATFAALDGYLQRDVPAGS
jgi:pimeloyl-ACP methyl ester carboxylesterase